MSPAHRAQMYSVPLYFTAVRLMSSEDAGAHLIPNSVLGSLGSLGTGFIVRATGRYYWLTFFCGSCSIVATLLLSSWSLDTSEWLMWTSFGPQAFSMGSVTTLTIVGLIADVGRDHVAVATSRELMEADTQLTPQCHTCSAPRAKSSASPSPAR